MLCSYCYSHLLWQLHQETDRGCKSLRGNCEAAAVLLLGEPSILTDSAQWIAVADRLCVLPWAEAPHGPTPEHVAHRGFMADASYSQCIERYTFCDWRSMHLALATLYLMWHFVVGTCCYAYTWSSVYIGVMFQSEVTSFVSQKLMNKACLMCNIGCHFLLHIFFFVLFFLCTDVNICSCYIEAEVRAEKALVSIVQQKYQSQNLHLEFSLTESNML